MCELMISINTTNEVENFLFSFCLYIFCILFLHSMSDVLIFIPAVLYSADYNIVVWTRMVGTADCTDRTLCISSSLVNQKAWQSGGPIVFPVHCN